MSKIFLCIVAVSPAYLHAIFPAVIRGVIVKDGVIFFKIKTGPTEIKIPVKKDPKKDTKK